MREIISRAKEGKVLPSYMRNAVHAMLVASTGGHRPGAPLGVTLADWDYAVDRKGQQREKGHERPLILETTRYKTFLQFGSA